MNRIIIGGTNSGCGKTSVTCGILSALKNRGKKVSAFKCGPDYIDPMLYSKITGYDAHNLDSFFCNDETLKYIFYDNSINSDISIIEGVMGFYDGVNEKGSAHSVSEITDTPAVIVIDCKGMSDSMGAVMKGFLEFRKPNNIVGFIFNRLPKKLTNLAEKLCTELGTEYFGYMPVHNIIFESRHLGLLTANEIENIENKLSALGSLAEKYILIDKLIKYSEKGAPKYHIPEIQIPDLAEPPVIAISKDSAFCFEYSENISLLKKSGCKIKYFSPISDKKLPENISGIILCGGYPELYAKEISENISMKNDIFNRIKEGIPAIAECGGFIYLHRIIEDIDGKCFDGVGIIDGKAFKTNKLQRFGYITMTAERDNLLCRKGEKIPAHEFHYWDSTSCGDAFTAEKSDGRTWDCVHGNENLYAGFPHIYFYSDIKIAERFVFKCEKFRKNKKF